MRNKLSFLPSLSTSDKVLCSIFGSTMIAFGVWAYDSEKKDAVLAQKGTEHYTALGYKVMAEEDANAYDFPNVTEDFNRGKKFLLNRNDSVFVARAQDQDLAGTGYIYTTYTKQPEFKALMREVKP